jgi:hypothetical protein
LKQDRKIAPIWILLAMFIAAPILVIGSCVGHSALQARRPKDMPNAIWIDAPAVPFGFYHGWWEGCWLEPDQRTNHCRLYGPGLHPPVVYEGRFMPCDSTEPIPPGELKLGPPRDSSDMWIFPGFVVFLESDRILVPIQNTSDCSIIRERLETKAAQTERPN